jgi:glucose/arabinose dehydrogenase
VFPAPALRQARSSQPMNVKKTVGRSAAALVAAIVAGAAIFLASNLGGWRVLVWRRLTRVENWPVIVVPPPIFQPKVPSGFRARVFARGFDQPRWLAVGPNGDLFVADSAVGKIIVLRAAPGNNTEPTREVFADHLNLPFGIAFHDSYVYVATTNEVVRFRYDAQSSRRVGEAEPVLDLPGMGYNQHWTRSLAFGRDGSLLFVSIGSRTNNRIESDPRRAAILVSDPDGKDAHVYAAGLRNAVGIACNPESGNLWAAVNERDDIDDETPPDYFTHVVEGGFYGWPYAYASQQMDHGVASRPDMVAKAIKPDVALEAHSVPLQFAFYEQQQFPPAYRHGAFIAEHGSWNRRTRTGYQVVFVPFRHGVPAEPPQPFFTGFVPDPNGKEVYGRMVGVAVAADGSLFVSDDAGKVIWKVSYDSAPL